MTSALKFYKTSFLCYFFKLHIKYTFFTNKINFGNLVTVGDTVFFQSIGIHNK
jgi:hypothetical protein